jgi:hypothetical protein
VKNQHERITTEWNSTRSKVEPKSERTTTANAFALVTEREREIDGLKVKKNDNDFSANHRTFLLI